MEESAEIFPTHAATVFSEPPTAPPRTASGSSAFDFGQMLFMSSTALPIRLPSWVINGAIDLPAISASERKVLIGDDIVPHQFGDPTKIVSYFDKSGIGVFSGALNLALTSLRAISTVFEYWLGYGV